MQKKPSYSSLEARRVLADVLSKALVEVEWPR
jgi:hypothetical protein